MAAARWFRYAYLAYFSRPQANRELYRLVTRENACRIVEIGIGDLSRAVSLIEVAQRFAGEKKVWYTGIDLFEARQHGPKVPLKEAYRVLRATEAGIRLVPGTPASSLASTANAHPNTDIILIGSDVTAADLQGAWLDVPRMLHAGSAILTERRGADGQVSFENVTRTQIAEWAAARLRPPGSLVRLGDVPSLAAESRRPQ